MRTKIVEGTTPDGLYLKAMVGRFDSDDWGRVALITAEALGIGTSLLRQEGWSDQHFVILDLSGPGNGGIFKMGGLADYDLNKGQYAY